MVNALDFAPWTDPDAVPLIRFQNVTKRFGDFVAIDDLTIDIYEREFFALLGPSGCGKTTLMRMLAGFETPTSGTITIGGQDMADIPANQRAVNMMFQSYALFPHLTVWENIAFGLRREGRDKGFIDARVEEMLRLVKLDRFAQRKPHQISGGQRQRVALARSLAKAPKLLLLDEPLGALDKKLRHETQFELMEIQETTGTTFVIVTHDQEEAMTVASRVAVMDEGKIVQVATPDAIYETPNSTYVADFIGEINLIPGTAARTAPLPPEAPATPAATEPETRANDSASWLVKRLGPLFGYAEGETAGEAAPPPRLPQPDGMQITWTDGEAPLVVSNAPEGLDGKPVTLAIRPEKITVTADKPDLPNAYQGKVLDIAYLGNVSTYHVELSTGLVIKAQTANTRRISARAFTWEDTVWVGWSGTAGVVLLK
ncbi:ABC transporter ATP-binding protein [Pseudaestuariivita sp.]|uniref:ABC transporter ATP-binding protein n=1 Tax=Pseudaestuariivita sp. TaxID=2211669 RepID=UPI0040588C7D